MKAGDTFRIAPTRCTGSPSKARAGRFSNCDASESPILRTVSGSTLAVSDTANATRRARSPGSLPSRSAAFGTGSLDSITAATSTLSSINIGSNRSASSAMILSHGSAFDDAPANLRNRFAAVVLICPSIIVSAPSIPPGNESPTCSSAPVNSPTTASSVVRSTIRIWPICSASAACICSGRLVICIGDPSASNKRTITAAFSRAFNPRGAASSGDSRPIVVLRAKLICRSSAMFALPTCRVTGKVADAG